MSLITLANENTSADKYFTVNQKTHLAFQLVSFALYQKYVCFWQLMCKQCIHGEISVLSPDSIMIFFFSITFLVTIILKYKFQVNTRVPTKNVIFI